jgi:capsular polysaccharide biosynthesis protein
MTTDTVRQRLSPHRLAGPRARAVARDTSTAARHVVLGLRIAGAAPGRWASAAAGAALRAVRPARKAVQQGCAAAGRGVARAGRGLLGAAGRARRRLPAWWPVAACTLLGALAGAGYGLLRAPEYTATSYVMVTSADAGSPVALGYAQAYGRIATGGAVLNRARTSSITLDALKSGVEAVTSPDAPMIEITGTAGDPSRAADMANRVAQSLTGIANLSSKDTGAQLRVFSQALTPDTPAAPSLPLSLAVGACAGGLIGALTLLVRPRRDGRHGLETVPEPAGAPATERETAAPADRNTKETV